MRGAMTTFLRILKGILTDHVRSRSDEDEFPGSALYRRESYLLNEPPFPKMMLNLLAHIASAAQAFSSRDANLSPGFYAMLARPPNHVLRLWNEHEGNKLKRHRHLIKACQYYVSWNY